MPVKSYNCSQQQLYTACQHGWGNCQKHLANFQQFSNRYKQSFINAQLLQVSIAQILPGYQARNAQSETLHIQLIQQATVCLRHWQKLKRYIASAYPGNMQKITLQAAGSNHYRKASRKYWIEMQSLLSGGSTFIKNNAQELIFAQNMPPVFQISFNTEKVKFQNLHSQFIKSEQDTIIATEQKIIANNNIHTSLISMLLDAQRVFTNQTAIQKQFTFQHLLQLMHSIKKGAIK